MTAGPLTLLLPTAPHRARRGLGVLASLGAHGVLLLGLLVIIRASSGNSTPQPVPIDEKQIMWVAPVPPPKVADAERAAQSAPSEMVPKPVAYAATPTDVRRGRDWRELLPRALALQAEGLQAPTFVIENLDVPLVGMLARRGLAVIVAGRPPFDGAARQVHWSTTGPTGVGALPSAWTQRVARRAIVVPRTWVTNVTLATGEEVYLLISLDLDAAILAAQLAAAEQRGVALDALVRTRGRLLPAPDGLLSFHIDAVDLHP